MPFLMPSSMPFSLRAQAILKIGRTQPTKLCATTSTWGQHAETCAQRHLLLASRCAAFPAAADGHVSGECCLCMSRVDKRGGGGKASPRQTCPALRRRGDQCSGPQLAPYASEDTLQRATHAGQGVRGHHGGQCPALRGVEVLQTLARPALPSPGYASPLRRIVSGLDGRASAPKLELHAAAWCSHFSARASPSRRSHRYALVLSSSSLIAACVCRQTSQSD
ncbi:hypothetical protein PHYPSEUDO_007703 [Phytophthora pseudosyringae]|uniref:Uncharacterized protein n=1 Tax=Phytophthora pseudosyringae TaxID=221518 RepID=A0A8T1WA56_9STRA|nr:hypothetical protein PHYPSEUDO_007703 [Phytophthora pseudosyringae]